MSSIIPVLDKVVIRRATPRTVTKGGIVIPQKANELPVEGEVVALGSGMPQKNGTLTPWDFKVGDTVVFAPNQGTEFNENGDNFIVLNEMHIHAVIERSPDEDVDPTVMVPLPPEKE